MWFQPCSGATCEMRLSAAKTQQSPDRATEISYYLGKVGGVAAFAGDGIFKFDVDAVATQLPIGWGRCSFEIMQQAHRTVK